MTEKMFELFLKNLCMGVLDLVYKVTDSADTIINYNMWPDLQKGSYKYIYNFEEA